MEEDSLCCQDGLVPGWSRAEEGLGVRDEGVEVGEFSLAGFLRRECHLKECVWLDEMKGVSVG